MLALLFVVFVFVVVVVLNKLGIFLNEDNFLNAMRKY